MVERSRPETVLLRLDHCAVVGQEASEGEVLQEVALAPSNRLARERRCGSIVLCCWYRGIWWKGRHVLYLPHRTAYTEYRTPMAGSGTRRDISMWNVECQAQGD